MSWKKRRGCCRDGLLCADIGVLLQPTVLTASHPTDMHAPSKINFPFRPCSRFSSRPLLREPLWLLNQCLWPSWLLHTLIFINDAVWVGNRCCVGTSLCRLVKRCKALVCHRAFWQRREGENALLVLSLLTGAFAAWCQRPVVITRLSPCYCYTNVPPALVCQLSSVIRLRAATAQEALLQQTPFIYLVCRHNDWLFYYLQSTGWRAKLVGFFVMFIKCGSYNYAHSRVVITH